MYATPGCQLRRMGGIIPGNISVKLLDTVVCIEMQWHISRTTPTSLAGVVFMKHKCLLSDTMKLQKYSSLLSLQIYTILVVEMSAITCCVVQS